MNDDDLKLLISVSLYMIDLKLIDESELNFLG